MLMAVNLLWQILFSDLDCVNHRQLLLLMVPNVSSCCNFNIPRCHQSVTHIWWVLLCICTLKFTDLSPPLLMEGLWFISSYFFSSKDQLFLWVLRKAVCIPSWRGLSWPLLLQWGAERSCLLRSRFSLSLLPKLYKLKRPSWAIFFTSLTASKQLGVLCKNKSAPVQSLALNSVTWYLMQHSLRPWPQLKTSILSFCNPCHLESYFTRQITNRLSQDLFQMPDRTWLQTDWLSLVPQVWLLN